MGRASAPSSARDLARFITDLDEALRGIPESAPGRSSSLPSATSSAPTSTEPEPLLDPLDGLGRFDALGSEVSRERFAEFVIGGIENLRTDEVLGGRPGAFGRRGVNVLDVNSLRHLRFRAVAVVGVAERSFPPPPRPDPLLLDDEREALNARHPQPLPLRVRRPDPEPLQFALATWAARERLLVSYPRKRRRRGRAAALLLPPRRWPRPRPASRVAARRPSTRCRRRC